MTNSHSAWLSVSQLRVRFGSRVLFDDLSFQLPIGQWTSLLGISGVGKSCLVRFIAGLLPQAQGHVRYANAPLQPGNVSYLAQQDGLLPWLTVLDNALLGARLRKQGDLVTKRQRAITLLQEVGLADAIQQRPAQLSGGMRQRVALVRCLIEDCPIVLMDEPFSGLDTITRTQIQTVASRLLHGKTVLLVTHDPLEALRLSERIVVLYGRPAQLAKPIMPSGMTPRSLDDPKLLTLQATLLKQLSYQNELNT